MSAMIRLTPVRKVPLSKLKINVKNQKYFKQTGDSDIKALLADIKKRGIQVPLVAKRDGTLLAGHRRKMIAERLKIKAVPVQYCVRNISEREEIEYIIKDNLLRRHLTYVERTALYHILIKNFDGRIIHSVKSGLGVSVKEVAELTGMNPHTINYDFSRIKHQKRKEANALSEVDELNEAAIMRYKKAVSRMINWAIVEKGPTIEKFLDLTKLAEERLRFILDGINSAKELVNE